MKCFKLLKHKQLLISCKNNPTQQAMHSIYPFSRKIPNIITKQQNGNKGISTKSDFDIKDLSVSKEQKSYFYKWLHLEINYDILHIVYLFQSQLYLAQEFRYRICFRGISIIKHAYQP